MHLKLLKTFGSVTTLIGIASTTLVYSCASSPKSVSPITVFGWKANPLVSVPQTIGQLKKEIPAYYDSLDESDRGEVLFNKLQTIQNSYKIGIHTTYRDLWNIYKDVWIDKWDESDDTIWDFYTEIAGKVDSQKFIPGKDQDGQPGGGEKYNREHMVPQSYFGNHGDSSKIKSDAHFVWPADKTINNFRANFDYEDVASISKQYPQGDKIGKGIITGSNAFEPVDYFKGDVARVMFYWAITWVNDTDNANNVAGDFQTFDKNEGFPYLTHNSEFANTYLRWSELDPVDKSNTDVNNAIASKWEDGLRNPFIDMPGLANLIWK